MISLRGHSQLVSCLSGKSFQDTMLPLAIQLHASNPTFLPPPPNCICIISTCRFGHQGSCGVSGKCAPQLGVCEDLQLTVQYKLTRTKCVIDFRVHARGDWTAELFLERRLRVWSTVFQVVLHLLTRNLTWHCFSPTFQRAFPSYALLLGFSSCHLRTLHLTLRVGSCFTQQL